MRPSTGSAPLAPEPMKIRCRESFGNLQSAARRSCAGKPIFALAEPAVLPLSRCAAAHKNAASPDLRPSGDARPRPVPVKMQMRRFGNLQSAARRSCAGKPIFALAEPAVSPLNRPAAAHKSAKQLVSRFLRLNRRKAARICAFFEAGASSSPRRAGARQRALRRGLSPRARPHCPDS